MRCGCKDSPRAATDEREADTQRNNDDADNGKGEVKTVESSSRMYLVPIFVVILGFLFFSASGGSNGLHPQDTGYSTVTFYVA